MKKEEKVRANLLSFSNNSHLCLVYQGIWILEKVYYLSVYFYLYLQVYSCPFCDEDAFDTQSKLSRYIVARDP